MTVAYRIGSLFSGYGGTDMAVINALGGGHVIWHSDVKPASIRLLAHRYPGTPNLGDLRDIDYSTAAAIDVLTASWPCQPHSSAGKRLGEADPRALWPEVIRAITKTRPTAFFGENVARITSNGELRRVIRSLAELGYLGAWRCVRASDIGACHRRDRCFIVAVHRAAAQALGVELRDQSGRGVRSGQEGARVTGHDGSGRSIRELTLLPTPAAQNTKGPASAIELLPTPKATDGTKGGPGMRGSSGDLMLPSAVMRLDKWKWGRYSTAIRRHRDVLGRPAPDPTQTSPRTGNPQLAPRFVEWMMMLPEGWVTNVRELGLRQTPASNRSAMISLLGDGVVPAQGTAAFSFLLDHLINRIESEQVA